MVSEFQMYRMVLKGVQANNSGRYVCGIEEAVEGKNWTMSEIDLKVVDKASAWSLLKSPLMWLSQPPFAFFLIKRCLGIKLLKRKKPFI